MRSPRGLALGLTWLGLLGFSIVQGQKPEVAKPEKAALDTKTVTVRLLMGVGITTAEDWGGKVALDKGEIVAVEGWRFRQDDRVAGRAEWEAKTRVAKQAAANKKKAAQAKKNNTQAKKNNVQAKKNVAKGQVPAGAAVPNGVFVALKAPEDATLSVETRQGNFEVKLADLAAGAARSYLEGKVAAQIVPTGVALYDGADQEDFPAAAADPQGNSWVAFVTHTARGPDRLQPLTERPKKFESYVPEGGGDQLRLLKFSGGQGGDPIDVTAAGLDLWRPAVAIDGQGKVVVVWSENTKDNWDIYRRVYDPAKSEWTEPKRLTTNPGPDADPALATAPDGTVWVAWQSWVDNQADILLMPADGSTAPTRVSESAADEWSPALAIDKSGRVHVAFDTYQAGNFDVLLRTRNADGTLGAAVAVATSPLFEARPSIAADGRGRVWVAYEERTANWGKDAENLQTGEGTTLYRGSAVRVRVVDGIRRLDPSDPLAGASQGLPLYNSFPRLSVDRSGRVWLAYRHRQEPASNGIGGAWIENLVSLAAERWSEPTVLPRSDGMLDNRPALVVPNDGPVLAFYNGDGRYQSDIDAVDHGLRVAALIAPTTGPRVDPALVEAPMIKLDPGPPVHPNEAADIARLRGHRISAGGKTYQLLRGEFHRHTEISADGGNDGTVEDMWRYALDTANLDWMGCGDHDNGNGKEYTWWLTQKTTDLYHIVPRFTPMFTYERSVQFPHGHRNVMWSKRGVRTLPRLRAAEGETAVANGISEDDTKMLYDYLTALDGITASHTSATTGMGTDWRDNNTKVEPFVEIFQGHRNSYEHLGAPRVARRQSEAIAGFQPYGLVWNALALQYRLGFQASSDHISTHISYGIAMAESPTRDAILDAFKKRHCYAATDNILLDVRSGDYLMGDEFTADAPVRLKVLVHGTRPIARVDVIKDFVYVYSTEPKTERVSFEWTDEERRPGGLSWYYVRALQVDGELAWASPFWVHFPAAAAAGE